MRLVNGCVDNICRPVLSAEGLRDCSVLIAFPCMRFSCSKSLSSLCKEVSWHSAAGMPTMQKIHLPLLRCAAFSTDAGSREINKGKTHSLNSPIQRLRPRQSQTSYRDTPRRNEPKPSSFRLREVKFNEYPIQEKNTVWLYNCGEFMWCRMWTDRVWERTMDAATASGHVQPSTFPDLTPAKGAAD